MDLSQQLPPFNFTAIGGNLATTPLLFGNSVLWKPSDNSILSNHLFYEIMLESGLPEGGRRSEARALYPALPGGAVGGCGGCGKGPTLLSPMNSSCQLGSLRETGGVGADPPPRRRVGAGGGTEAIGVGADPPPRRRVGAGASGIHRCHRQMLKVRPALTGGP